LHFIPGRMADPGRKQQQQENEILRDDQNLDNNNELTEELLEHPAIAAFHASHATFLVTDPRLAGNPIIHASPGFLDLTGYAVDRVLGRNCRFLQGPGTDPVAVSHMRESIDQGRDISVTLLNYRQDGSTFWNQILISGIRDAHGELIYFIGIQHPCMGPPPDGVPAVSHASFLERKNKSWFPHPAH
jgi:PAS domain S-box-containing protein